MAGSGRQRLIIFDCDGVLVDSEPIALAVMLEVLAQSGCMLSTQDGYANLLGRSLGSATDWLKDARGFDLTDDMMARMRREIFHRFRHELRPIPHIADILPGLGTRVCVASSSQLDRIHVSLTVTGLIDAFAPNIFSASMVTQGKPAPDLFLHAAREMDAAPEMCIVVEDSPAGIIAAKAAGMTVVGFVGGSHAEPARLAQAVANCAPDAIISDMIDLPACLRALS